MQSPGYLNGISRLTPKHFGSFAGASGAQKYMWGMVRQAGAAADNKNLKAVVDFAVQCGNSPVPGLECPRQMGAKEMHGKDMDWVIKNAETAVPAILAWYEKYLGTRDWWGNPASDPNKKQETLTWLKETIGSWAKPKQLPDGSWDCGYKPPSTDKGFYKCCPEGFKFVEYGSGKDPCPPPPAPKIPKPQPLPPGASGPGGPALAPELVVPQQQLVSPGIMILAGIAVLGLIGLTAFKMMS